MSRAKWLGLVAVLTLGAPAAASALVMATAADLAWPWDAMEGVPVDSALVFYGNKEYGPLGQWSVTLTPEGGEPIALITSMQDMSSGYFFLVATPDQPLAPNTRYDSVFSTDTESYLTLTSHFTTGDADADLGTPPAPDVLYKGLGVVMSDADGGWCLSSGTAEAGALAVLIDGPGLETRPVLIEAKDSEGVKVYDILLSGQYDFTKELTLAGDHYRAHFPVDPCGHYCVRAAALDQHGVPGTWSEWSCSEEIGSWECGDSSNRIVFGDEIPDGSKPSPLAKACIEGAPPSTVPTEEDVAALGGKGSDSTEGDSGCSATATSAPRPVFLAILGVLAAFLFVAAKRRRVTACVVAEPDSRRPEFRLMGRLGTRGLGTMVVLALFAGGCNDAESAADLTEDSHLPVDQVTDVAIVNPEDLAPDALVFAVGRGGGFAQSPIFEFYWGHHPDFTLYVFGDRRVLSLDRGNADDLVGYRQFRQGVVPLETFVQLLSLASAVSPDDGGDFQHCPAMDGGGEQLFVGLPGLTVEASSFTSFTGTCTDTEISSGEPEPPESLPPLYKALMTLHDIPTQPVVTDRIRLGLWNLGDINFEPPCNAETATPWPFSEPAIPVDLSQDTFWAANIEAPLATEIRDFIRTHLDDQLQAWYPSACISYEGAFFRAFYDDMLPAEEAFPF